MYLKNENLIIRQANENDAHVLCKWWSDGKIMAHAGFPNGLKTDINKLIDKLNKESDNKKRLMMVINNKRVGEMSYKIDDNIAEIGIKICNFNYQEKGYGSKAINMLIKYLFDNMKVNKIILDTNSNNKRAQHVYEKIGFKKTKVKLNSWKDQLGIMQSVVYYELSKEDFYN